MIFHAVCGAIPPRSLEWREIRKALIGCAAEKITYITADGLGSE
ncbi:hypothetical protein HMPREF1986_01671 [Oribacterium sp. oral taxon 078 str. F0263]|nr:hypothetical protein HMPREF1986_01671 [Oribacterium sp. oral taxon 078 str. F0263]